MEPRTAHHTTPRARAGRDRDHRFPGRVHRSGPSFHDDEWDAIVAAARAVDLTPTGFIAQAAYAHARAAPATGTAGPAPQRYPAARPVATPRRR